MNMFGLYVFQVVMCLYESVELYVFQVMICLYVNVMSVCLSNVTIIKITGLSVLMKWQN